MNKYRLNLLYFLALFFIHSIASGQYLSFNEDYYDMEVEQALEVGKTAIVENLGANGSSVGQNINLLKAPGSVSLNVPFDKENSIITESYNPSLAFQISLGFDSDTYHLEFSNPIIKGGLMALESMPLAQLMERHSLPFYGQLLFPEVKISYSDEESIKIKNHFDYYEAIIEQSNSYFRAFNNDLKKRLQDFSQSAENE